MATVPSSSLQQLLQETFTSQMVDVHTCLPGIIKSFDAQTQTASVNIALKRVILDENNKEFERPVAILSDIPVLFFQSQDFAITMPIKEGDNCLLLFSERDFDNWYKESGIQSTRSRRRFDYSDAFVLPMANTKKNLLNNYSAENLEIRSRSGDNKIVLSPDGNLTITNSGETTITSGKITINGEFIVNGQTTLSGALEVIGVATLDDAQITTGTIGGISFSSHVHPGVQSGPNTTGAPQ